MGGFRDFLLRGNVVELAVAVVIGAAFTGIVNAVVDGLINPVIGAFGTQDLDDYSLCLRGSCATGDGIGLRWGSVVSASLTFLITAAVVYFLMILPMNRFLARRRADAPVEPPVETELELLAQIRDELIAQRAGGVTVGAQRTAAEESTSLDKPSDGRDGRA
ncbi:large conductance mechanosensitive channel protein MscL [Streptomyces avicenniae]|uniref:large conductance mechanosensitive channel protein MscL n=1 Tax=Streptomyces avicenniae TaxID=500153 RepID=UPI000DA60305|nr:large conductance mechanosensitive channel protein MscL [Streptomyces avicenniae]